MRSASSDTDSSQAQAPRGAHWYCLRAKPKHEHIAAAHLKKLSNIEVFAPRIRFKKVRRSGVSWYTEALFPGYLFGHFNFHEQHSAVRYSPGINTIVRFGARYIPVPSDEITRLRSLLGDDETRVMEPSLRPGDEVKVAAGPFEGLAAVVRELKPPRERVKVLLEFLGRTVEAELSTTEVELEDSHDHRRSGLEEAAEEDPDSG